MSGKNTAYDRGFLNITYFVSDAKKRFMATRATSIRGCVHIHIFNSLQHIFVAFIFQRVQYVDI